MTHPPAGPAPVHQMRGAQRSIALDMVHAGVEKAAHRGGVIVAADCCPADCCPAAVVRPYHRWCR